MKISEMIKKLEEIKAKEGDLEVTIFDDYTANEGWDFKKEDLWMSATTTIDMVRDDNDKEIKKVVTIAGICNYEDEEE